MAAFGPSDPTLPLSTSSSTRSLPTGSCSYRDVVVGTCGCEQFWDTSDDHLHHGSSRQNSSTQRSLHCVCGHHACFHKPSTVAAVAPVASRWDNGYDAQAGAQCDSANTVDVLRDLGPPVNFGPQAAQGPLPSQHVFSQELSLANGSHVDSGKRERSLQLSSSGMPRIPSVCLLSNDRYPAANNGNRDRAVSSRLIPAGLGLSTLDLSNALASFDRPPSVTSTVPDDFGQNQSPSRPRVDDNTSLRGVGGSQGKVSPANAAPGPLDAILEFNKGLHLDVVGDTIPDTFNMEDVIHSATEAATPSNSNTPNLAAADQAILDGKRAIEDVMRLDPNADSHRDASHRPANEAKRPSPQLRLTNSPHLSQEQVQQVIKSASPQSLQKLLTYLPTIYNLLNSIPNVANTIRDLNDRVSLLETNNSFNYVHPDDFHERIDDVDDRLSGLETRMDDHDTLHQNIDADNSSYEQTRRRIANATSSFQSNRSLESTTSSARIVAEMDRQEAHSQFHAMKERLDVLEAFAMPPTLTTPWEVEVVILPWGRDLKGIWFSQEEPMHTPSRTTTQESEEWTQARSSVLGKPAAPASLRDTDSSPARHSSRSSHPFSDTESGWSSQAIEDWASGLTDELLSPKACKSTNMVYKRLKSRGFVKDVTIKCGSARDIQASLAHAFKDVVAHFIYAEEGEDHTIKSYPALRAAFIPLRKVRHDSRLRFLNPAEMSSDALWSAQFLASDVMMHVTGGKKRLYVTQREGYMQALDNIRCSWTWQELRQLPRYRSDADVEKQGNEEPGHPRVEEADAKEACWTYFDAYDAPPVSINSSFSSHHAVELSMRPADRKWRRSMTPISILKNPMHQPMSPPSEPYLRRPLHPRQRTVSASVLEPITATSSKRRLSSPIDHNSLPNTSTNPYYPPQTYRPPSKQKRRRISSTSFSRSDVDANYEYDEVEDCVISRYTPRQDEVAGHGDRYYDSPTYAPRGTRQYEAPVVDDRHFVSATYPPRQLRQCEGHQVQDRVCNHIPRCPPRQDEVAEVEDRFYNPTPRYSREPLSPFLSSAAPPLVRGSSDLASRPSQRSIAVARHGTPHAASAYATPYSDPLVGGPTFGGGDTEADEELYQDDDEGEDLPDDDGSQSWHGVTTGGEESDIGGRDAKVDMAPSRQYDDEDIADFSADGSLYSSDNDDLSSDIDDDAHGDEDDDDDVDTDDGGFGAQRTDTEDDDCLDKLLHVLGDAPELHHPHHSSGYLR